jgi:pilus assembly protein CpaB
MVVRLGIFLFLIVALILVSIFGYSLLNQSKQPVVVAAPPPPPTTQILVAVGPLSAGGLLQPSDITGAPVLVGNVPFDSSPDTPDNRSALVGSMVRVPIGQGSPILNSQVIHPGDHGFLAAVLAPGMRAVTVGVDTISGTDGLIWPGDTVDVMLTEVMAGAPPGKAIASEVVLSGVRVIATGQQLVRQGNNNAAPPSQPVTLEVTPNQAARCLVATNLGRLSLIVHSAQVAPGQAQVSNVLPDPVWSGDVSNALNKLQPPPAAGTTVTTVHVFQGVSDGGSYNFQ